jgi:hypothetical protein
VVRHHFRLGSGKRFSALLVFAGILFVLLCLFLLSLERQRYFLLSFDVEPVDGDSSVVAVLDLLESVNSVRSAAGQEKINVTFFVTGEYALKHREVLRGIESSGFEIGCHSFSHPLFLGLNTSQKRNEIFRCERALDVVGISHPKGFRAPYAVLDFSTARILERNDYFYDASSFDYTRFIYRDFNDTVAVPVSTFVGVPLEDVIWVYYLRSPSLFFWLVRNHYDETVSVIFHPHHVERYLNELNESISILSERNVSFISNYYLAEVSNEARRGSWVK